MLIDVNSIPLATAVAAEVVAWLLLSVVAICFLPSPFRGKVPVGVVGAAMLVHATTGLQRVSYPIVALMAVTMSASLITSFALIRGQWRRYIEAQRRSGVRSEEAGKRAIPVTFGLLGIVLAYMVIIALVFKGAGF